MKIQFVSKKFNTEAKATIETADAIIEEYQGQGFDLTLRQLYYQFVARGLIPNHPKEYTKLGKLISDARLAGMISWDAIVDRTRNLRKRRSWETPGQLVAACASGYKLDWWKNQEHRLEVWIEKDALVGVIADVCDRYDVPYFSCRGYTSQSEMWSAGTRLGEYAENGQTPLVIHLGDHDPSGIDMSRDVIDRLAMFARCSVQVERIALNLEQVQKHKPPPNPAKITDPRAKSYLKRFGQISWELDALQPALLSSLIENKILTYRDGSLFKEIEEEENKHKNKIIKAAKSL